MQYSGECLHAEGTLLSVFMQYASPSVREMCIRSLFHSSPELVHG